MFKENCTRGRKYFQGRIKAPQPDLKIPYLLNFNGLCKILDCAILLTRLYVSHFFLCVVYKQSMLDGNWVKRTAGTGDLG